MTKAIKRLTTKGLPVAVVCAMGMVAATASATWIGSGWKAWGSGIPDTFWHTWSNGNQVRIDVRDWGEVTKSIAWNNNTDHWAIARCIDANTGAEYNSYPSSPSGPGTGTVSTTPGCNAGYWNYKGGSYSQVP